MIALIDVLGEEEINLARQSLAAARFERGDLTAGKIARQVKNNDQALGTDPDVAVVARRIRLALEGHPEVRSKVRPVRWSNLLFSRYSAGQHYGPHTDNAVIFGPEGEALRTDMSFTLFLSDPGSYDGGALQIHNGDTMVAFKPKAGAVVFYPTGQIHSVQAVTGGQRLACVGWVQSLVRRADQREVLADLEEFKTGMAKNEVTLLLDKAIGNLLRMWGDP